MSSQRVSIRSLHHLEIIVNKVFQGENDESLKLMTPLSSSSLAFLTCRHLDGMGREGANFTGSGDRSWRQHGMSKH